MDKFKDFLASSIRAGIVSLISVVMTALKEKYNIEFPEETIAEFNKLLASFLAAIEPLVGWMVGMAYYAIVRLLEMYVNPWFGVLIGMAKQPVYVGNMDRKLL